MRKFLKALVLLLIAAATGVSSCTKVCDTGFEGNTCDSLVRTKYLGTFMGQENCGNPGDTFLVAFSAVNQDPQKILITNIYNANNLNAYGTVLPNGSVTIAPQEFGTGIISGDLVYNGGKLVLEYKITVQGLDVVTCNWVKR